MKHKTAALCSNLKPGDIIRERKLMASYAPHPTETGCYSQHRWGYPEDPTVGWFVVTAEWLKRQRPKKVVQLSDGLHARYTTTESEQQ